MTTPPIPVLTMAAGTGGAATADARLVIGEFGRRSDRLRLYAFCFFRLAGLVQIGGALALGAGQYPSLRPVVALATAVALESLLLVAGCLRRGRLVPAWISADVVFCTAALVLDAHLSPPGITTWARFFMYAFTIVVTSVAIGMTYLRLSRVLAMTTVISTGYLGSAVVLHGEPLWNSLPNAISYFADTVGIWAVVRELRRSAQAADTNAAALSIRRRQAHADALARASEQAAEQQRAHYARMLHDRILQTMETLATGEWIPDPDLRAHVAAEAGWLRAVVQGTPLNQPRDLLSVLQAVVREKARHGLRVEFNDAGLRTAGQLRATLTPAVIDAVAGAVGEALTNVTKHAAVTTAVLRATLTPDRLTLSVLDHGAGFDPTHATTDPPQGLGLAHSIRARIQEIGGTVHIDSAPGTGTHIELSIPAPTTQPDPPQPPSPALTHHSPADWNRQQRS